MSTIPKELPRDRNGELEPIVVPKNKRDISGIEEQVISLYSRGMSTRDIHDQVKEIYGIELSAEMLSKITDNIIPQIKSKAAYVVLGVNKDGFKNVIGIWIGENESSKFWICVLNHLKNRGVEDILIFSVDGLTGIKEAIQAAYPNAEIQRCIIRTLREECI